MGNQQILFPRTTVVANTNYTQQLLLADFDKILVDVSQDTTNPLVWADMALIRLNLLLCRPGRADVQLVDSILQDQAMLTDYEGGYSGDPTDSESSYRILFDTGRVKLSQGDNLNMQLQVGAVGTVGANSKMRITLIKTSNARNLNRKYRSFTSSGVPSFKDVLEVYQTSASSERTVTITSKKYGELNINDSVSHALTEATGKLETEKTIGLLYIDPSHTGDEIQIDMTASLRIYLVSAWM